MNKLKVCIRDDYDPESFETTRPNPDDLWVYDRDNPDLIIYMNATMPTKNNSCVLMTESYEVQRFYNGIDKNRSRLEEISKSIPVYSFDKSLGVNTICPATPSWVSEPRMYEKGKKISMITSLKNMCSGHNLRLSILTKLQGEGWDVDLFGREINPINTKEDGLAPYMFSIVVENEKVPGWHTEKILDCFSTGTIPLYWGDPCIGDNYDTNGIIDLVEFFGDVNPAHWDKTRLSNLTEDLYNSMLPSIQRNLEIAKDKRSDYHLGEIINKICQDYINGKH